jgi:OOP family OmpA-OmpF porin
MPPHDHTATPEPPADSLAQLRRLLLTPEQVQLVALQRRLDDPKIRAGDVSEVVAEAIAMRAGRDDALTGALGPTVEGVLRTSVRKNPGALAEALFPVMGPAIRKAIAAALVAMMQSLNQTLEQSLSLKGLAWRLEAWRTGTSFGEVVLLHTLLYRVEQVFLVHRVTGLPLAHRVLAGVAAPDASMVSGMLTAIQDFVRDSFGAVRTDTLQAFQVGELTVWIEEGPLAVLAAVIRGTPPQSLRAGLQHALERIHQEQGFALETFSGDPGPLEACGDTLDGCLQAHRARPATDRRRWRLRPIWIVVAVAAIALATWTGWAWRDGRRWTEYVDRLKAEPGIVVTNVGRREGKYFVTGLRDPLAADPAALVRAARLDPRAVIGRWEPYHALLPGFVLVRARNLLEPPAGVTLAIDGDVLSASGWAPRAWILDARRLARVIPGVGHFRDDELSALELRPLWLLKKAIEARVITFGRGSIEPGPGQREHVAALVADVKRLDEAARAAGERVRLEIIGHADGDASPELNLKLSRRRAAALAGRLDLGNSRAIEASPGGVGADEPLPTREPTEEAKAASRRVEFRVLLSTDRPDRVGPR